MNSSGQNTLGSPQADFTAEPPKNKAAPWQSPSSPKGENAWDRSQAARDHPEWSTTAYGTTDRWEQHPPSADTTTERHHQPHQHKGAKKSSARRSSDSQRHDHSSSSSDRTTSFMESGHTVQHAPSQRSVYRDLNNI